MQEEKEHSWEGKLLAALDLGSNSFHLVVAKLLGKSLVVLDRQREMAQLGAGVTEEGTITAEAQARALAALARLGERLRGVEGNKVRVVATNALRRACRTQDFILQAQDLLRHPIEILGGREEARLIYLGVAHSRSFDAHKRLVVDIGGGSTELIIGSGFSPELMESVDAGCVSYAKRFFAAGAITESAFADARNAAFLELEPVLESFLHKGWDVAIGTSGTINALFDIARERFGEKDVLLQETLQNICRWFFRQKDTFTLASVLFGSNRERAPILPAGAAILSAVMESLNITRMEVTDGALREGVLYDLIGRLHDDEDVRSLSAAETMNRFWVDEAQAQRVEKAALRLFAQVASAWGIESQENSRFLSWAARLHETGLCVSHSRYHRHGAYLLSNADLPGFSRREQGMLAAMVGLHRRKPWIDVLELASVPKDEERKVFLLAALLRLAVALCRARKEESLPPIKAQAGEGRLGLIFPRGFFAAHPLTHGDLLEEKKHLAEFFGLELHLAEH